MRIERHKRLESTQKYCLERINQIEEDLVVLTETQTEGVGREKNRWISCKGSLAFSVCIHTFLQDGSLVAVQCVKEVLERHGVDKLSVKWPNDLHIEKNRTQEKICGVIVNVVDTKRGPMSIIGVGINIAGEIPYTTLEDMRYSIDREKLFMEIVEQLKNRFTERKEYVWTCFRSKYIFLNEKKYEILSVKDTLTLENGQEVLYISPQEYSYCTKDNMLIKKQKCNC